MLGGRVVGAGSGIGVLVTARSRLGWVGGTHCDADGNFRLVVPVDGGDYEVAAQRGADHAVVNDVRVGTVDLTMDLTPMTFLDVRTLPSIAKRELRIYTRAGHSPYRPVLPFDLGKATDEEGEGIVRIRCMPGSLDLFVAADGFVPAQETMWVPQGSTRSVEVVMERAVTARLRAIPPPRGRDLCLQAIPQDGLAEAMLPMNELRRPVRWTGEVGVVEGALPGPALLIDLATGEPASRSFSVQQDGSASVEWLEDR